MSPEKEGRPDDLTGVTQLIETGHGKVYVGINDRDGDPFEVFIWTGHSGGYTNSWCDALAMTLSNSLRSGVEPEILIDNLMGVRGPKIGSDNGDRVFSIPDAVGLALKRHIEGKYGESIRDPDEEVGLP